MNYGWLEPDTELREYQRVVRHEFGHALGMIHEHQNPAAQGQIPWDKPKVYAYYAQQGWNKDDVDFQHLPGLFWRTAPTTALRPGLDHGVCDSPIR